MLQEWLGFYTVSTRVTHQADITLLALILDEEKVKVGQPKSDGTTRQVCSKLSKTKKVEVDSQSYGKVKTG